MKIDIICLGKFKKNQPLEKIFNFYAKRIKTNIRLVELKTFNFEKKKKKKLEKKEILKYTKKYDYIFALDRSGKALSSLEFAKIIDGKIKEGIKRFCFLVGSDVGLDKYFIDSYDTLSFGKQTWPHLLVRVMLIEQIYRAFEIISGTSYHK